MFTFSNQQSAVQQMQKLVQANLQNTPIRNFKCKFKQILLHNMAHSLLFAFFHTITDLLSLFNSACY